MEVARRILISDQLYACAMSISENLTEARLHHLQFLDWRDRDSALISIEFENGIPIPRKARCENTLEALTPRLVTLHVAGVTRSLSSALDCLAGVVVVIIALPSNVLRSSFTRLRSDLSRMLKKDESLLTDYEKIHAGFAQLLEKSIAQLGPKGWVEWLLNYRNMLVHRGRRIQMGQIVPLDIVTPDGIPVPKQIIHLPLDPGRSDVEVLRNLNGLDSALLAEDAGTTLGGLISSASGLVEVIAKELHSIWTWRRGDPRRMTQPQEQWLESVTTSEFEGYQPGEFDISFRQGLAQAHPIMARRLRAAAVDDQNRPLWRNPKSL